jgi:hypothetical protein
MDVRFGGDPAARERLLTEMLYPVRDTVLDKARLQRITPETMAHLVTQALASSVAGLYYSPGL